MSTSLNTQMPIGRYVRFVARTLRTVAEVSRPVTLRAGGALVVQFETDAPRKTLREAIRSHMEFLGIESGRRAIKGDQPAWDFEIQETPNSLLATVYVVNV